MNPNQELIEEFYAGFASAHPGTMASCYHEDLIFQDPIFGRLNRADTIDMWHMLIDRSHGRLKIEFSDVKADAVYGSARWTAKYPFTKTGRKVVNNVYSAFEFRDGLIYRQTDHFDVWDWSIQAFGLPAQLFGWSNFFRRRIARGAVQALRRYQIMEAKS